MRIVALAALAGAAGLAFAATPSFAYTTNQLQNQSGANFTSGDDQQQSSDHGFSFSANTTTSANPYDPFAQANLSAQGNQQAPSRDMTWQGSGYYLRPNN
jgi:hypothetical protein